MAGKGVTILSALTDAKRTKDYEMPNVCRNKLDELDFKILKIIL
jgi:hypothetical protein